jgi:glutamyl-Q tRNA(Asp) synthetase
VTSHLPPPYTGRFAPTPSGPLHFGSIVTALASFLQARSQGGLWHLRIDDLDTPRVKPGASDDILNALQLLSLNWDGEVLYQSSRHAAYHSALETLLNKDLLYRCDCPRKETRGIPYPGTCRNRNVPLCHQAALRVRTDNSTVTFKDLIQGAYARNIHTESGDFIVLRSDGIYGYPLAVVVDDAWQGVTEVIRGADLLVATPEQIWMRQQLGLDVPVYGHVPVATDQHGKKLSKRYQATDALMESDPGSLLLRALIFLGQTVDYSLNGADTATVIDWALENWDFSRVPRIKTISDNMEEI